MSTVVEFTGPTRLDIPVDRVLQGAEEANLEKCIIIGDTGEDIYLASSMGRISEVVYLLELAKHKLLSGEYGEDTSD